MSYSGPTQISLGTLSQYCGSTTGHVLNRWSTAPEYRTVVAALMYVYELTWQQQTVLTPGAVDIC